jgi:NAD(P)-dependent dehydrogenase (short-subunit alcohol dehydrogenase family)
MSDDLGCGLLEGRVLFVAGVGPLIGAATAVVAAREGARVVLAARRPDTTNEIAETIRAGGGQALTLQCDLGHEEQVRSAVDDAVAAFGTVDAVFYNAAYYDMTDDDIDVDPERWDRAMRVNLGGPMALAKFTIPLMVKRGHGSLVFNSSAASLAAEDVRPGYSVSKAGLNAFMRFVANKYGRQGIRANAILPFVAGGEVGAAASALNCIGRSGTAEEIGEVVTFLLSDRAAVITGEILHLDGGLFAKAAWPSTTAPRVPPPPVPAT